MAVQVNNVERVGSMLGRRGGLFTRVEVWMNAHAGCPVVVVPDLASPRPRGGAQT